jgi:hypothetical protein
MPRHARGARIAAVAAATAAVAAAFVGPGSAAAHPMGNFSVGQYAALAVEPGRVRLRYVLDLAEMPTYFLRAELALPATEAIPQSAVDRHRETSAPVWLSRITLALDGAPVMWRVTSGSSVLSAGAGGLPVLRMEVGAHADWPVGPAGAVHRLEYRDANYPERVGWKEVVLAAGAGCRILESSVPATDRTSALTRYPDDLLQSPLQVREATARIALGPRAGAAPGEMGSAHRTTPPGPDGRRDPRVAPGAAEGRVGPAASAPPRMPHGGPAPSPPPSPGEPSRDSSPAAAIAILIALAGVGLALARAFAPARGPRSSS